MGLLSKILERSPRLTAVAELKQRTIRLIDQPDRRSPRLTAVAELKHMLNARPLSQIKGFSTAHSRGRIEATRNRTQCPTCWSSPRLTAVAELKPHVADPVSTTVAVLHGSQPWPN